MFMRNAIVLEDKAIFSQVGSKLKESHSELSLNFCAGLSEELPKDCQIVFVRPSSQNLGLIKAKKNKQVKWVAVMTEGSESIFNTLQAGFDDYLYLEDSSEEWAATIKS
jgi:hypothetical protein